MGNSGNPAYMECTGICRFGIIISMKGWATTREKLFLSYGDLKDKRVFLRFEGVGACSEVYVNGRLAGTHKGGYSAFVVEIGPSLNHKSSDNEIVVKADNQSRSRRHSGEPCPVWRLWRHLSSGVAGRDRQEQHRR